MAAPFQVTGKMSAVRAGVNRLRIAWTTLPDEAQAKSLAHKVVKEKLVACAQVSGPITSFYEWKGEVCNDTEWRLTLKFPTPLEDSLADFVKRNHPYDTPQWISTEAAGSAAYVEWAEEATGISNTK